MEQEKTWLLAEKHDGQMTDAYAADCQRLEAGEPLAYVIGWVPFLDCKIWLDSHPLIPRPETEYWVERAITTINRSNCAQSRVLDLCAGGGCIGVAVAKAIPHVKVDFAELDPAHHPTIEMNVRENCAAEDIPVNRYIYGGDLLAEIPVGTKYDFILSNPPYIDPALDRTEPAVQDHEPSMALYGGLAGMEIINRIITAAPNYLVPGGQLWLEHEPEQSQAIAQAGAIVGFLTQTHHDQYRTERYSQLVLQ